MANFNKVLLLGNLTRDPELRKTPKGNAVTEFGLATNRFYTMEGGEKRQETTFVDIVAWGRQAELCSQYLSKGKPLFIEGRLQFDQWQDKNSGENRSKLRVVMENMQFIGSPQGGQSGGQTYGQNSQSSNSSNDADKSLEPQNQSRNSSSEAKGGEKGSAKVENPDFIDEDDDIPF